MARIKGVDIPDNKRVEIALTYIYGIGRSLSNKILELQTFIILVDFKVFSDSSLLLEPLLTISKKKLFLFAILISLHQVKKLS